MSATMSEYEIFTEIKREGEKGEAHLSIAFHKRYLKKSEYWEVLIFVFAFK